MATARQKAAAVLFSVASAAAAASLASSADDFVPPTGPDLASPSESPGRFRIALATSPDGSSFTATGRVVSEQANTPNLFADESGRLWLYYTGWRLGALTNTVAVAVSEDDGLSWSFRHLTLTGYPNGTNYGDPDVIALPEGGVRMFLTTSVGGRIGIVSGDSADGLRFSYRGTAASVPGDDVLDSTTFRIGASWHMLALTSRGDAHWHFTSPDAGAFALAGTLVLDDGRMPYVAANGLASDAGFRMFAFSLGDRNIRSFLTEDASAWRMEAGLRLPFQQGPVDRRYLKDPSVVRLRSGGYLMAYVTRADE